MTRFRVGFGFLLVMAENDPDILTGPLLFGRGDGKKPDAGEGGTAVNRSGDDHDGIEPGLYGDDGCQ
jgi:hypothetical protein